MARLQRLTVGGYVAEYLRKRYCPNHCLWLDGTDSEVIEVFDCNHPAFYRIAFADNTETIVDHNQVCYIQVLPGVVKQW